MSDKPEEQLRRERAAQVVKNAYHRLFHSEDGRVVLEDLKTRFRLEAPVFSPIQKHQHFAYDPLTAALTDGGRQVIIYIQSILAMPMQGDGDISPKKKPRIRKK